MQNARWLTGLALMGLLTLSTMTGCPEGGGDPITNTPGVLETPTQAVSIDPTPTAIETATQPSATASAAPTDASTPTAEHPDTPTAPEPTAPPTQAQSTHTDLPIGDTPTEPPEVTVPPQETEVQVTGTPIIAPTDPPVEATPTQADTPTPTNGPTATNPPEPTDIASDCGNLTVDPGESCDDGGRDAGDGCSPTCQTEPDYYCDGSPSICVVSICGDGDQAPNEACDDGEANSDLVADACRTDCTLPDCGDGVKDAGELCDEGIYNNDDNPNSCRTDCTLSGCGDGVKDLGEQCDEGDDNSNEDPDSCRTNCTLPRCGDGVADTGEQCDEGVANSNTEPDACRRTCQLPFCGDGVLDTEESCDEGALNSDELPDSCRTNCAVATCGDGVLDTGEQCDEGFANSDELPNACRTSCRLPTCGDGIQDEGEGCDDGDANSDTEPGACRTTCEVSTCGDGVQDPGEACDNGDANSDSDAGACRTDCELAFCGDGVTDPGEGCDDGNHSNLDDCSTECAATGCGDGFVQEGEECDEGDENSDDDPDACRETCVDASCGDGVVDTDEACDDGAENSDSAPGACRTTCEEPVCGDGVTDPGEQCDLGDANSDEDGLCSTTCTVNIDYENILTLDSDGAVVSGDWADFYSRMTDDVADCKVRFDNRVARVEHVEYNTNSVYLDFQPLYAYHNNWDSYAYIHLNKGVRAGLGAAYRRGHADNVTLKDRTQHAEAEFYPMLVDVFCPRVSGYTKVAGFNTRGEVNTGSFDELRELVVDKGATCKIRADKRVMKVENIEFADTRMYFDMIGLHASHDTWDAYAYAVVDLNQRAGLGAAYRRGHGNTVYKRDRDQHAEAYFSAQNVDVFCADDHINVGKMLRNGAVVKGDWDEIWELAAEEGRSCKFKFDGRVTSTKYMEYISGNLRFDTAGMHAFHDSWDAYTYIQLIEGGQAGVGTSYRRGRYQEIWKQSYDQHTGGGFFPEQTDIFCEKVDRWEPVFAIDSSGNTTLGDWDEFYDLVVNQAADCKVRFDGRLAEPVLLEYQTNYLLFDHANLAAMHNSWDAYMTHIVQKEGDSGVTGSYRRGHDDTVWKKDRDQHALYTLQAFDQEFLCRRPGGEPGPDPDCGNGQDDAGEECDDGGANSDDNPDACRADCTLPVCGDGVVDTGEECDEGSDNSNWAGSTCSTTCTTDLEYEHVVTMTGDGTTIRGDFDDAFDRITEGAADCKVKFDDRISDIKHVEYTSNNLLLDFQPLHAYHNNWDSYAYINLQKGVRAGLGSTYRRGHADNVWQRDRTQHAEAEFYPMTVTVMCERTNPYQKLASFTTSGETTTGSFEAVHEAVVERGATCKLRVDRRIVQAEHIEYSDTKLYFDLIGLHASHDTHDAYAYIEVDQEVRAGIGASYRRGHGNNVHLRDRAQYAQAYFGAQPVDVFCADEYKSVAKILPNGAFIEGTFDDLWAQVVDEARSCKVRFDTRIAQSPYTEFFNGDLRFEFTGLHAFHDSYDAFAYALVSEGGASGVGTSYRRGRYQEIWKRSRDQHSGGLFAGNQMEIYCEAAPRWHKLIDLDYEGYSEPGQWDSFYEAVVEQGADCKARFDGRITAPWHVEYAEQDLLLDNHGLAGMHNSWDAYATHVISRQAPSGITGTYRRGHDDTVWKKDRDQHALHTLQPFDTEILCRRPLSASPTADTCGDGEVQPWEECDDGAANSNTDDDACRADCTAATCGDGVVDSGEDCDEGDANSDDAGASCSTTCTEHLEFERVMRMNAKGTVLDGSWDDLYTRITDEAADCRVRFDERVSKVEHVEYASNSLYLDFQPLNAYHNNWDSYAYIHLQKGSRAGLGATYRRGHASNVALKDRAQHAEAEFYPMTVDVFCARDNPYERIASFSSNGAVTDGSWEDLQTQVTEFGADCKVRVDGRLFEAEHVEYDSTHIYFDALGLSASHDTWDAYAYVDIAVDNRAGLGASYRRGHGSNVHLDDRTQHAEAYFLSAPVDVFCADRYDPFLEVSADGTVLDGDWLTLFDAVSEEGRSCKIQWDDRISQAPYVEFFNGELRFEFTGLHAYHDSWDAYAYASISAGDWSDLGTSYRRGRYQEIWKRSEDQHSGALIIPTAMKVLCEREAAWQPVVSLDYDGTVEGGRFEDLFQRMSHQGADCKVRWDGRIANPPHLEFYEGSLLVDHHGLAAMHNSWDAYATHIVRHGDTSGVTGSYRRGHDDTVWKKDRDQHALFTLQPFDVDLICR